MDILNRDYLTLLLLAPLLQLFLLFYLQFNPFRLLTNHLLVVFFFSVDKNFSIVIYAQYVGKLVYKYSEICMYSIIMYTSIGSILSVQSKMAQPVKGEPVYLRERLQSREEHAPGQEASFLSLSLKGGFSLISDLNF